MCRWLSFLLFAGVICSSATAQESGSQSARKPRGTPAKAVVVPYPPTLPDQRPHLSITTDEFIVRPESLQPDVIMAKRAPQVDFVYYPGQTYEGRPWSNWGNSTFANGRYYSAIGDHLAPQGNAFVYEYNPEAKTFRLLTDVSKTINLPDGHYTPGKVHSHLGLAKDGWLYFSTHRGSTKATTAANHYTGDWLLRANPETGVTEIVERGPVPGHCLPTGEVDGPRMIFYGSTAPGDGGDNTGIQFFAYDLAKRKMIYAGPDGPSRAMILSSSTGRVYFTPGQSDTPLMRFDPATGQAPQEIPGKIGIRAVTAETPQGIVYAVSFGRGEAGSVLSAFDVKTESVRELGPAGVGINQYIAAIAADPTGRYLYYIPGAHGGSEKDNTAIVQYDTKHNRRKVIACLHPWFEKHAGCILKGTYTAALDERGERLFVTWNVSRGTKVWDSCGLTVIHIPESERQP